MKFLSVVVLLLVGTGSALAKECRMPDVPPGVQVQLPPGCKEPLKAKQIQVQKQDHVRADQGFVDVGNGTKIKVGGRVRAEYGFQR